MALNVISNFAANVAHRNLTISDAAASASLTKLSSGQRVVSARDDAAALAIGSRLRAEVVAMKTASVNAGQAGSMLQIADGAMGTIADILVRMKELAVQASSGQFSNTERKILDSEFQALRQEITRISDDTEFNGTQLIAGGNAIFGTGTGGAQSATTGELAGGSAPGIKIIFDSSNIDTSKVADEDTFRISYVRTSSTDQKLTLTNTNTGDRQTIDITAAIDSVLAGRGSPGVAGTGNLVTGETVVVDFANLGVKITLDDNFVRANSIQTEGKITVAPVGAEFTVGGSLTVEYATSNFTNADLSDLLLLDAGVYNASNGELTITFDTTATSVKLDTTPHPGLQFEVDGESTPTDVPTIELGDQLQHTVRVYLDGSGGGSTALIATIYFDDIDAAAGTAEETIKLDVGNLAFGVDYASTGTDTTFKFKVGTGNKSYDTLTFDINSASSTALGINSQNIATSIAAETASDKISTAIDTLNSSRSTVGAAQNRLTFAAQNLASAIENAEAARSTLLDLDVAAEITVFTSKQVLLQTGIAMLAQANQLPQNLLRLFQ